MSMSTDAEFWWGITFEGGDEGAFEPLTEYFNPAFEEYAYGDGREWLRDHGFDNVELVSHCSSSYPMYGLAVKGTHTTAYRGSPRLITTEDESDRVNWAGWVMQAAEVVQAFLLEEARKGEYPEYVEQVEISEWGWWLASDSDY